MDIKYIETQTKQKQLEGIFTKSGMSTLKKTDFQKKAKSFIKEGKNMQKEVVADSKQNHGYRYAVYKGVKKNQHYTWLICAAQNMKNISIKNDNVGKKPLTLSSYIHNFIKILENIIKILFKIKPLEKIQGFVYTLKIDFLSFFIFIKLNNLNNANKISIVFLF